MTSHDPFELLDTLISTVDTPTESQTQQTDEMFRLAQQTLDGMFVHNESQFQEMLDIEMMMSGGTFLNGMLARPNLSTENTSSQPLKASILEHLPVSRLTPPRAHQHQSSTDTQSCSICFEQVNYEDNKEWMFLQSCTHYFHKECIIPWFQSHSTCPVCRQQVTLTSHLTKELGCHRSFETI